MLVMYLNLYKKKQKAANYLQDLPSTLSVFTKCYWCGLTGTDFTQLTPWVNAPIQF